MMGQRRVYIQPVYFMLCVAGYANATLLRYTYIPYNDECPYYIPDGNHCVHTQDCSGPQIAFDTYEYAKADYSYVTFTSTVQSANVPCAQSEICMEYIARYGSSKCMLTENMTVSVFRAPRTQYYCKRYSTMHMHHQQYISTYSQAIVQMVALFNKRKLNWYTHATAIRDGNHVFKRRRSQYSAFYPPSTSNGYLNVTLCNRLEVNNTYKIYTAALAILK